MERGLGWLACWLIGLRGKEETAAGVDLEVEG